MNRFAIPSKELLTAAMIFVAVLVGFFVLGEVSGWPNETSGWPLALIAAAVLAAASPAMRVLGELEASRASVTLPGGISFHLSANVIKSREEAIPQNIVEPGLPVDDTSQAALDEAAKQLAKEKFVIADLKDGRAWYRSRLFALAGTAATLEIPKAIIILGTKGGEPRQLGGWILPRDVIKAMIRDDKNLEWVWGHARAYLVQFQTGEQFNEKQAGQQSKKANPYPKYDWYKAHYDNIGEVVMRILVDQMRKPDLASSKVEDDKEPEWFNLQQAEELFAPWLVKRYVDLDTDEETRAAVMLGTEREFVLALKDDRYVGMIDVQSEQRRMLKEIFGKSRA